ncbi:MAG: site-specific integrase [Pseudomonadota bacterium]
MTAPERARLTRERIRKLAPPAGGERTVWDTEVPGLGVRCRPSGVKSYVVVFRASGRGRAGTPRRVTLGNVGALPLADARAAAMELRAQVLAGRDPVEERRQARAQAVQQVSREQNTLSAVLARYAADQQRRNVVDRAGVQSALQRHLLGAVGDVPVAEIERSQVIAAIEALEAAGKPGAAKALRGHASTFFKWASDRAGLIPSNPLAGYRAARATRAQRIEQTGRALSDDELRRIWHACEHPTVNAMFGRYVRMLILTGQRRTETAAMTWENLDRSALWWTIPPGISKNGIAHEVPLPPEARALVLSSGPRPLLSSLPVFTTNGAAPISGFSKLLAKLRAAARVAEPWTPHDLRRTFRSGLTRLGVESDLAEIMLNHRPGTLRSVYDRDPRLNARREAGEAWAEHVATLVTAGENVHRAVAPVTCDYGATSA